MADFDPDAYIAQNAPGGFDPDAYLAANAPPPARPPQVGQGETFINRAINAVPLGKAVADSLSTLALKAFGPGDGTRLTPQALAQLDALGEAAPTPYQDPSWMDVYRGTRDRRLVRTEAGSQQNPWTGRAGTGLGLLLTALAPGMRGFGALGKGAMLGRVLPAAFTGLGYGAEAGLEHGSADLTRGEFGQAGKETGLSALLGLILGGVAGGTAEGVTRALPGAADVLEKFANRKALNALGASKPQLNELGSKAAEKIGQFARDEGVVTSLAGRQTMAERAAAGIETEGKNIGGALAEADAAALPGELLSRSAAAAKVQDLANQLRPKPALENVATKFEQEAGKILKSGAADAPMSLAQFEELIARPYKRTTVWDPDLKLPKEMLKQLPMALEQMVEQATSNISKRTGVDLASRYGAAKGRYGRFLDIADLAEEGLKKNYNNSIGLKDLLMATTGAAMGVGHGAGTSGLTAAGLLFGSKLNSRFGDQLAARGSGFLGNALRRSAPTGSTAAASLADLAGGSIPRRQPVPMPLSAAEAY